uniref:FAD-binding PCMH-type domain-containing protein n=1 Tax=Sexangularia sp. CB-2014 TaxID=1486929 RepID=A0A7S1VIC4_9EUKA
MPSSCCAHPTPTTPCRSLVRSNDRMLHRLLLPFLVPPSLWEFEAVCDEATVAGIPSAHPYRSPLTAHLDLGVESTLVRSPLNVWQQDGLVEASQVTLASNNDAAVVALFGGFSSDFLGSSSNIVGVDCNATSCAWLHLGMLPATIGTTHHGIVKHPREPLVYIVSGQLGPHCAIATPAGAIAHVKGSLDSRDIHIGHWSPLPPLPAARYSPGALVLDDDSGRTFLHIFAGFDELRVNATSTHWRLPLRSDGTVDPGAAWQQLAADDAARADVGHALTVTEVTGVGGMHGGGTRDHIPVVTGDDEVQQCMGRPRPRHSDGTVHTSTGEWRRYQEGVGWQMLDPTPVAVSAPAAFVTDGWTVLVGGRTTTRYVDYTPFPARQEVSVSYFDEESWRWGQSPDLPQSLEAPATYIWRDRAVAVQLAGWHPPATKLQPPRCLTAQIRYRDGNASRVVGPGMRALAAGHAFACLAAAGVDYSPARLTTGWVADAVAPQLHRGRRLAPTAIIRPLNDTTGVLDMSKLRATLRCAARERVHVCVRATGMGPPAAVCNGGWQLRVRDNDASRDVPASQFVTRHLWLNQSTGKLRVPAWATIGEVRARLGDTGWELPSAAGMCASLGVTGTILTGGQSPTQAVTAGRLADSVESLGVLPLSGSGTARTITAASAAEGGAAALLWRLARGRAGAAIPFPGIIVEWTLQTTRRTMSQPPAVVELSSSSRWTDALTLLVETQASCRTAGVSVGATGTAWPKAQRNMTISLWPTDSSATAAAIDRLTASGLFRRVAAAAHRAGLPQTCSSPALSPSEVHVDTRSQRLAATSTQSWLHLLDGTLCDNHGAPCTGASFLLLPLPSTPAEAARERERGTDSNDVGHGELAVWHSVAPSTTVAWHTWLARARQTHRNVSSVAGTGAPRQHRGFADAGVYPTTAEEVLSYGGADWAATVRTALPQSLVRQVDEEIWHASAWTDPVCAGHCAGRPPQLPHRSLPDCAILGCMFNPRASACQWHLDHSRCDVVDDA